MQNGDRDQVGRDHAVGGGELSNRSEERTRPMSRWGEDEEGASGVNRG